MIEERLGTRVASTSEGVWTF